MIGRKVVVAAYNVALAVLWHWTQLVVVDWMFWWTTPTKGAVPKLVWHVAQALEANTFAPRLMASTAISIEPYAVIKKIGVSKPRARSCSRTFNPEPSGRRNFFTQQKPCCKSRHYIANCGDGHYVAEVRPTEQSHVGDGPENQQCDAQRDPRMEERGDQGERRIADIAQLGHAFGKSRISGYITEYGEDRKEPGLSS